MPSEALASSPKGARPGRTRKLAFSERAAIIGLLGVAFVSVLAFGASDVATSVLFASVYPLFLLGLLASCGWARRDLARLPGLKLQAILFALLLATLCWPLTAWGPDGPHPVWAYVEGRRGSLTVDRSAVLLGLVQFLGLACLFVVARIVGASSQRGRWLLRAAVLAMGAYAVMAFADFVVVRRSSRLAATLLSPNTAATVFGGGLILAIAAAGNRIRRFHGLSALRRGDIEATLALAVAAILATCVLLTASRAGVAATLAGLGLFLIWEALAQRHRLKATAWLGVVATVLLIGALSLRSIGPLAARYGWTDGDLAVRTAIFAPHWQAFLSTPWCGFGLGSFVTVNALITTSENLPVLYNVRATHNLYLQWLEEGGVVGAGSMLALFVAIMAPVVRGGLREGAVGAWARAATCGAVVFLLHGITDFALQTPAVQALVTILLGVVVSLVTPPRATRAASPVWPARLGQAGAGIAAIVAILLGAPLLAAKTGGDLSAWPTAPADALASAIEGRLAQAPDRAGLMRIKALSLRELDLRPGSGSAWLRRAAIEAALGDQAASNTALERSFAVAPLQASLFEARTVFAYEHWGVVSQSVRDQTLYQMKAEWLRAPQQRRLVAVANDLHNPTGRVGMALQINALRLQYPALVRAKAR